MAAFTRPYREVTEFPNMVGVTMTSVVGEEGDDEMTFVADDGRRFRFYYEQDCCASCNIVDIGGDLADLVGSPILRAEEVSSEDAEAPEYSESYTWTFYKFETNRGSVTVRWLGQSNGYYSESVTYAEEPANAP